MNPCKPALKILWRAKYLVVLLLTLSVLAWMATYSNEDVKSVQLSTDVIQARVKDDDPGEEVEVAPETESPSPSKSRFISAAKTKCPQTSPLLQGVLKLTFEPSLKLEDVERDNKEVSEGRYEPTSCASRQSVAILIPFRNREKHLLYFLHHLHPFLQRQQLHYAIYVIHQAGDATFNRAKLLNIGYLEALKDYKWDCFIFHDVDLVPENDYNLYVCENQPKHLVVGRNVTGYKLRYKGYFGGVTAMTRDQFLQVNGFSNDYWGWGGEDDDLRVRVTLQKMEILRPPAEIARYTMVFHKRDTGNEVNANRMNLLAKTPHVWRQDGLNSCTYQTLSVERQPLYVNVTVDIGGSSMTGNCLSDDGLVPKLDK